MVVNCCSLLRISWRCLLICFSCCAAAVWLAVACSARCCDSCCAVAVWFAACSASCWDSCCAVAVWLAVACSAGCCDSCCAVVVLLALACSVTGCVVAACGFSGFSALRVFPYFSIFEKRLLSSWRRGSFSFLSVTVVDSAASFRFAVTGNNMKNLLGSMELKSGVETHVLALFVGFLAVWAVNQASVQSGGLHVKCTCSRPIRRFVYVIARVARGGVIPFKRNVFNGCSRYCEPGWSRGSCHDVVQTESSFGVIFVTFALSNFFKWLFGWVEIMMMARLSIGLMHRCSVDVAMSVVRCCRRRLWRETTWMAIVRTPPWRFSQG